ncbi:Uncharacterized oxidoreductase SAV2478 [Oligella ureolytica]|uniref:SDR family NAD(P)-dependent oxidoreductase n=1 Tax=Oligella ureolytica TaxID=90244 RepID=UPI000E077BE3|nr:SDR family NAD(P)-dependent oxidoreductase [Oligella ureolytica]SUA57098.1 Uncharacterized oxidoreductase SAV2478 [Oligella ureolytica]
MDLSHLQTAMLYMMYLISYNGLTETDTVHHSTKLHTKNDKEMAQNTATSNSPDASALIVSVGATQGVCAAIAGRNEEKLCVTAQELAASGAKVAVIVGDASRAEDAARFVAQAEALPPMAIAVQNAASNVPAPFFDTDEAHFKLHWREHTLSAFQLAQASLPPILERGTGTLIFTGASASLRGKVHFASFAAAKAGMRMLSQSLAHEYGKQGIHVASVVIDGMIKGERALSRLPDLKQDLGPDGMLNIEAIAEAYWVLHHQQRSAWTLEMDLRPWAENF